MQECFDLNKQIIPATKANFVDIGLWYEDVHVDVKNLSFQLIILPLFRSRGEKQRYEPCQAVPRRSIAHVRPQKSTPQIYHRNLW